MKTLVKFFIKGGTLAPTDLAKIVEIHDKLGGDHIQFTHRQEVLIRIDTNRTHMVTSLAKGIVFEVADINGEFKQHNVVSSFLTKKIDASTYWVKQSSYLEILDNLEASYGLRINLTDLKQDIVYSFTGDANFVASDEVNYWFLYLRNKGKKQHDLFPYLIYSEDVATVIEYLDSNYRAKNSIREDTFDEIRQIIGYRALDFTLEPRIKVSEFFNYEGLHLYDDKYWLGIYMRDSKYSTYVLSSLVDLCRMQMIGQIHITPWKSLIIKEIDDFSVIDWKLFLSTHGINNGHSSAELNWQLKDFDSSAVDIKAFLRKEFGQEDVNVNGIIFGVDVNPETTFAHVLIEKNVFLKIKRGEFSTYNIFFREDFNPIKQNFKVYKKLVLKSNLAETIKEVVDQYHDKAYKIAANFIPKKAQTVEKLQATEEKIRFVHRCKSCFTIYYPEYGDMNVEQGTSFENLASDYCCSICDAPKSEFEKVNMSIFAEK